MDIAPVDIEKVVVLEQKVKSKPVKPVNRKKRSKQCSSSSSSSSLLPLNTLGVERTLQVEESSIGSNRANIPDQSNGDEMKITEDSFQEILRALELYRERLGGCVNYQHKPVLKGKLTRRQLSNIYTDYEYIYLTILGNNPTCNPENPNSPNCPSNL